MQADNEMKEYIKSRFAHYEEMETKYRIKNEPVKYGFYMGATTALMDLLEILEDK